MQEAPLNIIRLALIMGYDIRGYRLEPHTGELEIVTRRGTEHKHPDILS